jgi:tRNA (uracil-5-)-methyltransferase TRM9
VSSASPDQRRVWTAIADSFDRTRRRPWPHVVAFLESLPAGTRVLDLMAGNGRHAKAAAALGLPVLALDWSAPLLRKAPAPTDRVLADAAALPLRDAAFGACVYAAGLHGLPTAAGRAASLAELRRVLRPGGTAQVTVWSRAAPRFAGVPPGQADVVVPWKADGAQEVRHYHLYTGASLRADLDAAGFQVEALGAASIAGPADNLVATVRA